MLKHLSLVFLKAMRTQIMQVGIKDRYTIHPQPSFININVFVRVDGGPFIIYVPMCDSTCL